MIKNFTLDIKNWLKVNIKNEIQELEIEQSKSRNLNNKTSLARAKKIESKRKRLESLDNFHKFIYNPNGDNLTKDSLNHNEVISITADLILNKELFQQIIITKYPIILIDESQDTKKELIDAFFKLQSLNKNNFSLGLFGDTMQRIYTDGKESLGIRLPNDWITPAKKMNHRSKSRIINLVNKIRHNVDAQEQLARLENTGGYVRFFSVSRDKTKSEVENYVCQKMKEYTGDEKWGGENSNIMTLILEHHMAAKRMGFSSFFDPLYKIDKLKTSLLDGSSEAVNFFTKIVLPIYIATKKENRFEIANYIKQYSPLISKQSLSEESNKLEKLHLANEKLNELLSLWDNGKEPTLLDILNNINSTKLFKIPNIFKIVLVQQNGGSIEVSEGKKEEDKIDDNDVLNAWEVALSAKFSEIVQYNKYINSESKFATHQGVKGLEYERVMVVIDDDESRGFLFSYDKLFEITPLSTNDEKNIEEGKDTGIDRTKRLFYVACSRAKESLAIVSYTDDPETLKNNVINFGWFSNNEVEIIN
ncbi:RecBCD enzyme subunit RecB [termite gut metagenome]|uniref:RecBCD enzyme subunit RecB n=1 Tax=termite gut metagenome TaxID=433724 RepID=A0A5J4QIA4_9ZZZZ